MDLTAIRDIVAILASFGTLTVAAIALYNIKIVQRQLKLTEKQVVLSRSGVQPFVKISRNIHRGNSFTLELENNGKGPANRLGLKAGFWPLTISDSKWNFDIKIFSFEGKKKQLISPTAAFIPLNNESGKFSLLPSEKAIFNSKEIMFMFNYPSKKGWRFYYFDEMKELMKNNGINYLNLSIALVYSDYSESIMETEGLTDIIIDFQKHKNITDAISDEKPLPLPSHAINLSEVPGMEWEHYKSLKTGHAFAKEDDNY